MLVLMRRVGERVNIGDNIEIIIGEVKGNQVKLCVIAPKEIAVHRNEIYLRVKKEQEENLKIN